MSILSDLASARLAVRWTTPASSPTIPELSVGVARFVLANEEAVI